MKKLSERATFLKILSNIKDFKNSALKQLSLRLSEIIHGFLAEAKPSFSYNEVNTLAEDLKNEVLKYFSNVYEELLNDAISFIKTELERSTRPSETIELAEKVKQLNDVIKTLEDLLSSTLGIKVEEGELVDKVRELLESSSKTEELKNILKEREKLLGDLQKEVDDLKKHLVNLEEELSSTKREKELSLIHI